MMPDDMDDAAGADGGDDADDADDADGACPLGQHHQHDWRPTCCPSAAPRPILEPKLFLAPAEGEP